VSYSKDDLKEMANHPAEATEYSASPVSLAKEMKPTKDKWNWALIITGVMLLIFSAMFANTDLIDAGEGIRVGFMKMALGMGFMAAPFLAAIWFGFQGLLSGIICKDWKLLSGLAVSLLLYIPAFLLHFLFSMTVIHLFQIRSAIATFCISVRFLVCC